ASKWSAAVANADAYSGDARDSALMQLSPSFALYKPTGVFPVSCPLFCWSFPWILSLWSGQPNISRFLPLSTYSRLGDRSGLIRSHPTFRHDSFQGYKSTRPPRPDAVSRAMELMQAALRALELPSFAISGVEADDVIATLATEALQSGMKVGMLPRGMEA
ncbi:unnamed protein product, partial [Closterium sp. NIES-54]